MCCAQSANCEHRRYPARFEFRLSLNRQVFALLEGKINNKRSLNISAVAWGAALDDKRQRPRWIGCLLTILTVATSLFHVSILPHRWTAPPDMASMTEMQNDNRSSVTPPARDPNLAIEEEYQLALRQGTVQALELFIARHPEGPLAERARADLRRLAR